MSFLLPPATPGPAHTLSIGVDMDYTLPVIVFIVAIISLYLSSNAKSEGTFFKGISPSGKQPGLLMLVFSQVTTWIFARSLMNAAILGFYYGIWGTLAYAIYYLSFLTGGLIIDRLRFEQGHESIQAFLMHRFGPWGTACYNFVIGIRLVSEVFANMLVIGILFGMAGTTAYTVSIVFFAFITLCYSMIGGMHASLRTDVFQMLLFIAALVILLFFAVSRGHAVLDQLWFKPFKIDEPGPILMLVALLQIWSYPMHDPVMMDRGFLADRETTRRSFLNAAWLSSVCIIAFGMLGVLAGANAAAGESMTVVLTRLLGTVPMIVFNAALVISAMSTLDSTYSSSAKLVAVDMGIIKMNVKNGRIVMAIFMLTGLGLVFLGNKDLFSAVAVSGTASMYLTPVIFFSLWGKRDDIPVWSYVTTFVLAVAGSVLYFTESSNYTQCLGEYHKYTKLLIITLSLMTVGNLLYWIGGKSVHLPYAERVLQK